MLLFLGGMVACLAGAYKIGSLILKRLMQPALESATKITFKIAGVNRPLVLFLFTFQVLVPMYLQI